MEFVPSKFKARDVKEVVLAIKRYEKTDPKSLDILKSNLNGNSIKIEMLTVIKEGPSDKTEVNRVLVARKLKDYEFSSHTINDPIISDPINRFAIACKANLIALLPHRYPVVKKMFHHSISRDLTNRATIPVLALR